MKGTSGRISRGNFQRRDAVEGGKGVVRKDKVKAILRWSEATNSGSELQPELYDRPHLRLPGLPERALRPWGRLQDREFRIGEITVDFDRFDNSMHTHGIRCRREPKKLEASLRSGRRDALDRLSRPAIRLTSFLRFRAEAH